MIRLVLLFVLLSMVVSAQEVHPRTVYDGRGRPDGNAASSSTGVPTATPRWRLDLRGALRQETWSPARGSFSDPHVLSDVRRLFYIREGEFHAVAANTGGQLWTYSVGKGARFEVVPGYLIVVSHRTVHNLDAQTGEVRWRRRYRAPEGVETFAVHDDLLTVIVGERLIAYELATGRECWRVRGLAGLTYDPHHTVLSASDSVVFLGLSTTHSFRHRMYSPSTGQQASGYGKLGHTSARWRSSALRFTCWKTTTQQTKFIRGG